eukprot:CAMPEP_0114376792 /NCGR_PEP_ID=MMETSP0102-20121206/595_1 /TAXON_ID=38822 ORGANISM="Pteridomonas danica, Strain PT" /NCGR_SAMPLE_ID=MMETSP0102 /ASSEMBLY_ACC=CAM_ASM_000212 /LENGTH=1204 /DNA_ID=CAMNT_0001531211 /DNA_START=1921 /DNA_END=5532 /DNA_ORIENTATION=+
MTSTTNKLFETKQNTSSPSSSFSVPPSPSLAKAPSTSTINTSTSSPPPKRDTKVLISDMTFNVDAAESAANVSTDQSNENVNSTKRTTTTLLNSGSGGDQNQTNEPTKLLTINSATRALTTKMLRDEIKKSLNGSGRNTPDMVRTPRLILPPTTPDINTRAKDSKKPVNSGSTFHAFSGNLPGSLPTRAALLHPGASTTRSRVLSNGKISSMLDVNDSYPLGSNKWHPDIVHASLMPQDLSSNNNNGLSQSWSFSKSPPSSPSKHTQQHTNSSYRMRKEKSEFVHSMSLENSLESEMKRYAHRPQGGTSEAIDKVIFSRDSVESRASLDSRGASRGASRGVSRGQTSGGENNLDNNDNSMDKDIHEPNIEIKIALNPVTDSQNHFQFHTGRPKPTATMIKEITSYHDIEKNKDGNKKMKNRNPLYPSNEELLEHLEDIRKTRKHPTTTTTVNNSKQNQTIHKKKKHNLKHMLTVSDALQQIKDDDPFATPRDDDPDNGGGEVAPNSPDSQLSAIEKINKRYSRNNQNIDNALLKATNLKRRSKEVKEQMNISLNASNSSNEQQNQNDPKVWMWKHIKGSEVGNDAGLISYNVIEHKEVVNVKESSGYPDFLSDQTNGGIKNMNDNTNPTPKNRLSTPKNNDHSMKESPQDSLSRLLGKSPNSPETTTQIPNENEKTTNTAPYYFYLKSLPAPSFAPAPLAGPLPPKLRSDVYQKAAPKDYTPLEGSEHQVVCGWALSTKTCIGVGFHQKSLFQISSFIDINTTTPHSGNGIAGLSWASPPELPWALEEYPPYGQWRCIDKNIDIHSNQIISSSGSVVSVAPSLTSSIKSNKSAAIVAAAAQKKAVKDATQAALNKQTIQNGSGGGGGSKTGTGYTQTQSGTHTYSNNPQTFLAKLLSVKVGSRLIEGGIPYEYLALLIRAPKPRPKPLTPPPKDMNEGPKWDYKVSSLFIPRGTRNKNNRMLLKLSFCDSRSMHDHEKTVRKKAFESDWSKCMLKEARFLNLMKKGSKEHTPEVQEAKKVLFAHYNWILYIFVMHAATDVNTSDASYMGWLSFGSLMEISGITDSTQKGCRQADLDTIFKATNFEVKGSDPNDDNPLESLTRQEFLESLIRVAKAKFGSKHVKVANAIEELIVYMKEKMLEYADDRNEDFRAVDQRDKWRLEELYTEPVDKVLRQYMGQLEDIFLGGLDLKDVAAHKFWTLSKW